MKRGCLPLLLTLGLLSPLQARPVHLRLDPGKSVLYFDGHTPLHSIQGHVKGAWGEAAVDPDNLDGSKGSVGFYADSLFTGIGMRDRKMRGSFLDASHYPRITFTMTSIHAMDSSRYGVHGALTIKGHSRRIVAPTETVIAPDSSFVMTRGRFQIKLSDFGIGRPRFLFDVMHDQVEILYNLRWVRQP